MAKPGTSIRLRAELKEELERRARESGTPASALYERFIDEGLRRDDHPLIAFRDAVGGRRPTLAGSRLTVAQVIETLLATEGPTDSARIRDTAEYLDIPTSHVQACVRYYASFREEVDGWRKRMAEAAEREHEVWERERDILA